MGGYFSRDGERTFVVEERSFQVSMSPDSLFLRLLRALANLGYQEPKQVSFFQLRFLQDRFSSSCSANGALPIPASFLTSLLTYSALSPMC